MNEIERQIIENARSYQNSLKNEYVSINSAINFWFQNIHKHYKDIVLGELRESQERLVEYWPCYVIYEARIYHRNLGGRRHRIYNVETYGGKYGTGYVCITDSQLHLYIFEDLTRKFPPYKIDIMDNSTVSPFLFKLNPAFRPTFDSPIMYEWTMPLHSILSYGLQTRLENSVAELITNRWQFPCGNFDILEAPTRNDDLTKILTTIHMALSGKLSRIWNDSESVS